jgi:hypothetical protein
LSARGLSNVEEMSLCTLHAYDASVPFRRDGQYEHHRRTIDRRLELGSVTEAVVDEEFLNSLRLTLGAWGIGRRASILLPLGELGDQLARHADELGRLDGIRLEDPSIDLEEVTNAVWQLINGIGIVENDATLVAGSKALAHLLPDLVVPIDRRWTGRFFSWSTPDMQYRQQQDFEEAFRAFAALARATQPSRLVGGGWRTTPTKIVDNALIGFCKQHGLT